MARIKFYVISCSSDGQSDARSLYVWGQLGDVTWLPESIKQAKKTLNSCRKKTACEICDGIVHEITINRKDPANLKLTE